MGTKGQGIAAVGVLSRGLHCRPHENARKACHCPRLIVPLPTELLMICMDRKVRVRFAPSPTGPLHIGGVRTALYNYLFAKQHNGDLILRIEDTDSNRFVPGAEEYIQESFRWLGIRFDEGVGIGGPHGPYRLSELRDIYKNYVRPLLDAGKAYITFDTPTALEKASLVADYVVTKEAAIPEYDEDLRRALGL